MHPHKHVQLADMTFVNFSFSQRSCLFFLTFFFNKTVEGQPGGTAVRGPAENRVQALHQDQSGARAGGLLPRFAGQGGGHGLLRATGAAFDHRSSGDIMASSPSFQIGCIVLFYFM